MLLMERWLRLDKNESEHFTLSARIKDRVAICHHTCAFCPFLIGVSDGKIE